MKLSFHKNHRYLFGVIFFGFVGLTAIVTIVPGIWVQEHNYPLPGSRPLTAQEQRGMNVYVAEGCLYCHTQMVRPLDVDKSFGRPSAPGDYARLKPQDVWRMTPEILGTERTGPDLSDVARRLPSDTWHYIHLYNPRAVVKGSVMQAYPWLFEVKQNPAPEDVVVPVPQGYAPREGKVVAAQKAKDLVAYLLSLKQVPIAETSTSGQAPPSPAGATETGPGAQVYASHCASCHQSNGEGVPGAFPPMKGDPVATDKDPTRHIEIVLFGLKGTAIGGVNYTAPMPAQAEVLSDSEIAGVINYERKSWGNNAPTITPQDVAKIRNHHQEAKEEHR
jgi:cytochrome c oxidase cbb3-type subunit 2